MAFRRKLIKQILLIIKNLDDESPRLADIEFVKDASGVIVGYRIEIKAEVKDRPKLELVSGKKVSMPS